MIRSDGRIRMTHQGTLPRPDDLRALVRAQASGAEYDADELAQRVSAAVKDGSSLNLVMPMLRSMCQGGICRSTTFSLIERAQGRASL